jgi:hypothetical protein
LPVTRTHFLLHIKAHFIETPQAPGCVSMFHVVTVRLEVLAFGSTARRCRVCDTSSARLRQIANALTGHEERLRPSSSRGTQNQSLAFRTISPYQTEHVNRYGSYLRAD